MGISPMTKWILPFSFPGFQREKGLIIHCDVYACMCVYPFSYSLLRTFKPCGLVLMKWKVRAIKKSQRKSKETDCILTPVRGQLQNSVSSCKLSGKGDLLKMFNSEKTSTWSSHFIKCMEIKPSDWNHTNGN